MGKNLKGKELGEGICQRKDGRYAVRFKGQSGKKYEKYFQELQDAKLWLEDIKYAENHSIFTNISTMTVNEWFNYWCNDVKDGTVKQRTLDHYMKSYRLYIQPKIANMKVCDVKTLHCQKILNELSNQGYKVTTIKNARKVMNLIFSEACNNELIEKNPCTKVKIGQLGEESQKVVALTLEEQKKLLDICTSHFWGNCFKFILQTGLRSGELLALQWSDINFKTKQININKTIMYNFKTKEWVVSTPKTKAGAREIPLTTEAIQILQNQKELISGLKLIQYEWKDNVFLSKKGEPINNTVLNGVLHKLCERAEINPYTVHSLRHTFATRCLEAGMKPKTLQEILGHTDISTTLNIYTHITNDEKEREINAVANYLEHLA